MKSLFILALLSLVLQSNAQTKTVDMTYRNIPNHPEAYTDGALAARMIDGLGFRYYWATEGLNETDLNYKPSDGSRTTIETIKHIYDLTILIRNTVLHEISVPPSNTEELDYVMLRQQTLQHLKTTADILRTSTDLSKYPIKFTNSELPFWFLINGPISDAIWHCGQIASFRRTTGNPISSDISFFSGTVKN